MKNKNRFHGNSITKTEFNSGGLSITLPVNEDDEIDWKLINYFIDNNGIVKIIKNIINESKYNRRRQFHTIQRPIR